MVPLESSIASNCSSVSGFCSKAALRNCSVRAIKSSFFATKSVSHCKATTAAKSPSVVAKTHPSDASRSSRFAATACPFLRIISTALSKSPFASLSAFLQSIIPAPVILRRCWISAIVTAIFYFPCFIVYLFVHVFVFRELTYHGCFHSFGIFLLYPLFFCCLRFALSALWRIILLFCRRGIGFFHLALIQSLFNGIGNETNDHLHRLGRVIISGNHKVDVRRVGVGIHNREHRNT